MKAVIMAGGEGTRLRPITCTKPKPMIDVFNRPALEHIIELLKGHGITDIAVTLQYMPQSIIDYFGDGKDWGVNLQYFIEHKPLGTAGSVKNAQEFLGDEFLVISGDCITDINLTDAINFHREKRADATLILKTVATPLEYGVVVTDSNGHITRFLEKPDWSEVFSDTANTGIYILNANVVNLFSKGEKFDFSGDVFPQLLEDGKPIFGFVSSDYWCDIGDTGAYMQCHKERFVSHISPNATIASTARIVEPVYIADGAVIGENASILPYSVVGQNSRIGEGSSLKGSVVHRNAVIGKQVQLRGAIICDSAAIGSNSAVYEGAVIGAGARLGEMVEVKNNIKVWAKKSVSSSSIVTQNIIWGNNFSRNLFGEHYVSGEVNVDITPEFATRLGATFGATIVGNSARPKTVGIGYGSGGALLMLKNAFISGLLSAGCGVYDFDVTTLPLTRSASQFYKLDGGVYLSFVPDRIDPKLSMHFIDKTGANLPRKKQRALEQLFMRDDFLRCEPEAIGNITEIKDYNSFYLRAIANDAREDLSLAVSVVCQSDVALNIARTALEHLGADVYMQNYGSNLMTAFIDETGEEVILHDENGARVSNEQLLYIMAMIIAEKGVREMVLPLNSPQALHDLARARGIRIVSSKTSRGAIQEQLIAKKLLFQFNMMFDANFAIVHICEYLEACKKKLHEVVAEIPQMFLVQREISCAASRKGEIIKRISQESGGAAEVELKEGVKLSYPNGWVMVMPHRSKPLVNVMAEGVTQEFAEELCVELERMIRD